MSTNNLFNVKSHGFKWSDLPFFIRDYYNYMLGIVHHDDLALLANGDFKFYNTHFCLAFNGFQVSDPKLTGKFGYCDELNFQQKVHHPDSGPCFAKFIYDRTPVSGIPGPGNSMQIDSQVNMGAVIWLYYYEKMGIFKILGKLLDQYNYEGKYTIRGNNSRQSILIEHISLLYRMGISSNLRDRVCLYERSLGLSVDNSFGMTTIKNEGFMKTFDDTLKQALEHYAYRRLDNAIGAGSGAVRSSVATLTTIKDSLDNLKNQFQPFYFGRNALNTFLGIATVYATISLVRLLKSEIGISDQYNRPQEFIPAAYDILVMNRPAINTDTNRFMVYDNCASYGYRLLTDFEFVNPDVFSPSAGIDDPMNIWLNNIEPLVEGYKNALKAVAE